MRIIGIAGKDRSGKDSVAELYMKAGYFGFSFGDAVRRYTRLRHADEPDPISVRNMTETSNWLRSEHGPDVILKEALQAYEESKEQGKEYKGIVLYSVRAPIEVEFILSHGGELVWVESSDDVRHKRKLDNLRTGEAKVSLSEMLDQEALQATPQPNIPKEVQMDLTYVKEHSTRTIENNSNDRQSFEDEVASTLLAD